MSAIEIDDLSRYLPPDPRQMRRICVRDLVIDAAYQRDLATEDVIQRMANEWSWNLAEALTVIPIGDGRYRVIEGQRRTEASRRRDPDASHWCIVLADDVRGVAAEADAGLRISKGRTPFHSFDEWQARVRRGDPHEVAATKVLQEFGLRMGKSPSAQSLGSAHTVMRLIHGHLAEPDLGAERLRNTLLVLTEAWPHADDMSRVSRFDHRLIEVVGGIITRNDDVDLDRLATKLATRKAGRWIEDCIGQKSVLVTLREAIINSYNKGLRTRKAEWA